MQRKDDSVTNKTTDSVFTPGTTGFNQMAGRENCSGLGNRKLPELIEVIRVHGYLETPTPLPDCD